VRFLFRAPRCTYAFKNILDDITGHQGAEAVNRKRKGHKEKDNI
jgi:hypothetical protein